MRRKVRTRGNAKARGKAKHAAKWRDKTLRTKKIKREKGIK